MSDFPGMTFPYSPLPGLLATMWSVLLSIAYLKS